MNAIELTNVSKQFHDVSVVQSLSFAIPQGQICAFLGSNGAGKSTTMNMMITLLKKNAGKIWIHQYDLDEDRDEIRKQIGVVFQEDVLDADLTIYENLCYRGGLYITNRKQLKQRIEEVSCLLHLEPMLHQSYRTCSGGQKRLVQIGRAILPRPKVLILDEPTIGLDPLARQEVWSIIRTLNKDAGMTIFFSTHYMEEAVLANQVCILHEGVLLACQTMDSFHGPCEEPMDPYRLQQRYIELLQQHTKRYRSL